MQDDEKQVAANAVDQVDGKVDDKAATSNETQEISAEDGVMQQLKVTEAKAAEMQDAFLRAKAEMENVRRRAQEDVTRAHKFAVENFAESLLAVKDSLEMALNIQTPSVESLKEGVDMTLKQLAAAFEKNKLLEISPAV